VAAAKTAWLQRRHVERTDDLILARLLGKLSHSNRTALWIAEEEKDVQALTLEQVNGALRKYIDLNKLSVIKAGDFSKARALQPASK
jgi:zinc protease